MVPTTLLGIRHLGIVTPRRSSKAWRTNKTPNFGSMAIIEARRSLKMTYVTNISIVTLINVQKLDSL